eukprot:TRINITY_DN3170_c0_g1_i4.p1 TRINITY_DN3170_c0_g1~~TRINITY_DN3170_c0_g1_i4.p1  ORF type:complete len:464 (-),score=42.81 TRINITY_DN3170_c0_g1_i4:3750-5141(-)
MAVHLQMPAMQTIPGAQENVGQLRCQDFEQESGKDCTYFTRTGCCSFGNDCKFRHDRSKILPISGYTENGYPLRPGCDVCTFYLSTGWCNHWFSCSKDHDINRLSNDCRESLPPPTIMEQFHRFKYDSTTKEYKPLSSNHLPDAIRNKRWIVGNEYGQSALPRSAQTRIISSFKNGVPEDVKERLARFLPNDLTARNMQLMRAGMGGYLAGMPVGGMLPRAASAPYASLPPSSMVRPQVTSKIMTPATAAASAQAGYAAAAAAGYQPSRLPSYQSDPKNAAMQAYGPSRYYSMMPSSGQTYAVYSPAYGSPAYSMDAPNMPAISGAAAGPPVPVSSYLAPQNSGTLPPTMQSPQSAFVDPTGGQTGSPNTYPQAAAYQQAQYQYMYAPQGVSQAAAYHMPMHMSYPQHGWSYADADNGGGQIMELEQTQSAPLVSNKGNKIGDDRCSILEDDLDECLYCNESQ